MVTHPGQKRKLRVAHASREFHPSEDLSELPLPGQEYQRWCCHRKTDRPRSAFWTVGSAPHLICRFHADSLHRWIFALPPMSLPILCLYKAHQRMYFRFWICTLQGTGEKHSPFQYYAAARSSLISFSQKLPIKFKNIFNFDSVFLCLLLMAGCDFPTLSAYSLSLIPSK